MLRLHRGWGRLLTPDGAQVWSLTSSRRFKISGDPDVLARTFGELARGVPDSDRLAATVGHAVEPVVRELQRLGVVLDDGAQAGAEWTDDEVYRHQIEFFDQWETSEVAGAHLQAKLRSSAVLILGIGAFGSWMALQCARIGIGRIVLVDPDVVERSNLARQVIYTAADVGQRKVDVASRVLRAADPQIDVQTYDMLIRTPEQLAPLAADVDLVFNSFGFRSRVLADLITRAAVLAGTPSLQSGGSTVGPLLLPGRTACPRCVADSHSDMVELMATCAANRWRPPRAPFAPMIATMSSLAVWEAARHLSGCAPAQTINAVWLVDMIRFRLDRRAGTRRPDCPLCGDCDAVG